MQYRHDQRGTEEGRKEATTTGVIDDEAKPRETTLSLFAVATWEEEKCIGKVIPFHFRLGVGIRWLTDKKSKANIYPCNIPRRRDANQPPMPWLNPVSSAEYGADSAWRRMTMVSMLVVQAEMCTSFDLKVVHLPKLNSKEFANRDSINDPN